MYNILFLQASAHCTVTPPPPTTAPYLLLAIGPSMKIQNWRNIKEVLNHHCDLDLEHSNITFSQDTPAWDDVWSNEFGYKRISSPEDKNKLIFWLYEPSMRLDLEAGKWILLHNTPAHDASPYHILLQKVKPQRRYHLDKHSMKCLTFAVTLAVNTAKPLRLKIMMYNQTKFGIKRISSSKDIIETVMFLLF